jgi:hypothetical protein
MTEFRRSGARFEPGKSHFDATPYYRFGSLEYNKIARACAREKNPIQTNI